jgi:hypothetical protein
VLWGASMPAPVCNGRVVVVRVLCLLGSSADAQGLPRLSVLLLCRYVALSVPTSPPAAITLCGFQVGLTQAPVLPRSTPDSGGGGGLSAGAVAGIVVGGLLGLALLALAVAYLRWRRVWVREHGKPAGGEKGSKGLEHVDGRLFGGGSDIENASPGPSVLAASQGSDAVATMAAAAAAAAAKASAGAISSGIGSAATGARDSVVSGASSATSVAPGRCPELQLLHEFLRSVSAGGEKFPSNDAGCLPLLNTLLFMPAYPWPNPAGAICTAPSSCPCASCCVSLLPLVQLTGRGRDSSKFGVLPKGSGVSSVSTDSIVTDLSKLPEGFADGVCGVAQLRCGEQQVLHGADGSGLHPRKQLLLANTAAGAACPPSCAPPPPTHPHTPTHPPTSYLLAPHLQSGRATSSSSSCVVKARLERWAPALKFCPACGANASCDI